MAAKRKKKAARKPAKRKAAKRTAKKKTTKRKATKKKATKRKATKKKATKRKATKKKATKRKATKKKATKKKAAKKKKVAKKKVAKTKTKRKPNAAFMRAMTPDAHLAAVVGSTPLPRTQVTKSLWAYIKKNNLQDAQNRRMINADAKLKPVFNGKKQVSMFEMTKLVNKHMS